MSDATGEKRLAQVALVFGQLLPRGFTRESFAGKKAHPLDEKRLAALKAFIESGMAAGGIPGVALGLVQDGKVIFAGGFGVRELGKPAKVDADTRFIVASNTKALTTLMLAALVDQKKIAWDSRAADLLPSFKLGDADTTSKVLVKHLICACTGMPRQDLEWIFEYGKLTPDGALSTLGTMKPTSRFGELYQYSNPMAAAAGFIGGHLVNPKAELGAAYDEAMQSLVFGPLQMTSTTLDFKKAQAQNWAAPHSQDIDDKPAVAVHAVNQAVIPVRPAGGAWSTINDMLKYVQMELSQGLLPDGKRYVSSEALLARRAPQVAVGKDTTYGMGLMVHTRYGATIVSHGGDLIGFHSDMMWLPDAQVGAVILTNGDPGWLIRSIFRRKLLEVLYDGRPEADAELAAATKAYFERRAGERKLLTVPAAPEAADNLARRYASPELGSIVVSRKGGATVFDFGEWQSEMASKKNPDGSMSFVTVAPGLTGFELTVGARGPKRTLVIRDAQHEYVFEES
jgi:CubicO group peptidase (beta-lactamase class C family)